MIYPASEPTGKKSKTVGLGIKSLLLVIVLFLAILTGMLVIFFKMSPSAKYQKQLTLGQRYLEESDYEAAIIAFNKAIEIDPKQEEPYWALADAYVAQGDYKNAFATLQLGLKSVDNKLKIRDKIEEIKNTPLRKEDLAWVEEPKYAYEDIEPLYSPDFGTSVEGESISDGVRCLSHENNTLYGVEMNFPSYSCLEEYYNVFDGEMYRLFYMPDKVDSDEWNQSQRPFLIHDSDGIYLESYPPMTEGSLGTPWDVFGAADYVPEHDIGILLWDEDSEEAYVQLCSYYGITIAFVQAADIPLHKAYAIRKGTISGNNELTEGESLSAEIQLDETSKYALWSPKGRLLTDFLYDDMESSSYGITAACKDGKWGYLDEQGNEVTEFIYDAPWEIMDGSSCAYPCTSDTMVVSLNGELGVLYKDGSPLMDFGEFEDIAPAWNDELWVKQDGLWGLIDLADAKEKKYYEIGSEEDSADTSKRIASYEIVRDERDKHGYDVEVYFERPVFEETALGYQLINEFFEEQSDRFFSNENTDLNTLWELAEEFSSYDSDVSDYGMECFATAEVTYQSEDLVSVLLFRTRCYGGSDYSWDEGYLFHADTGKRVKLTEILDGTEEEIKSMIEQAVYDKYGDDVRIHSTIADYPFDGLNFYVKEGKAHVTFAKYEIFGGSAGIVDVALPANLKFQ